MVKKASELKAGDVVEFADSKRRIVSVKPFRNGLVTMNFQDVRFDKMLSMTVQNGSREFEVIS